MSLGKHKFYCEMCRKQCKDENAFQQHKRSSFHQGNMIQFNENPEFFIQRFSQDVQEKFCDIVRTKYGYSSFIPANRAYNEYIKDPYHTHLNSTRWASLSEFVLDLESQGLLESTKEIDPASGLEQIMIRMVDKDQAKKEALAQLNNKETMRELERRREQKDLEKMIKQASKMQKEATAKHVTHSDETQKEGSSKIGLITFEPMTVASISGEKHTIQESEKSEEQKTGFKAPSIGVKKSVFGMEEKEDKLVELQMLQKNKKSNLDKLLEHAQPLTKRPKIDEMLQPSTQTDWVRQGLIEKIKKNGPYLKQKGEVIKILNKEKIQVKLQNEYRETKEFTESELQKVLPSEGGRVLIFSKNIKATLTHIDLKNGLATAKIGDTEGNKEIFKVKFDDLCKINQ